MEKLRTLAAGRDQLDLARGALWSAQVERPQLPVSDYVQRIEALAERVRAGLPVDAPVGDRVFALNAMLFDELKFEVVNEARPDACLLDRVLEERRARPAVLSALYLTVGRLLGLPLTAIPFPGRPLIGFGDGELLIDPASGGNLLSREDLELMFVQAYGLENASAAMLDKLLKGSSDRRVLLNVLFDLERAYAEQGELEKALEVSGCLLTIKPESALAHRERAKLFERLDCHQAAHADYRRYLELSPQADDSDVIAKRMLRLARRAVTLH